MRTFVVQYSTQQTLTDYAALVMAKNELEAMDNVFEELKACGHENVRVRSGVPIGDPRYCG